MSGTDKPSEIELPRLRFVRGLVVGGVIATPPRVFGFETIFKFIKRSLTMKKLIQSCCIAISTLAFVVFVQAHDFEEHVKDAEKPDCAAIKNMDHAKMDMDDPVMQAMMKKCAPSHNGNQRVMEDKMNENSEKHMTNTEKPDCAALEGMDHSKMDMNDPTTQEMKKECMSSPHTHHGAMEENMYEKSKTESSKKAHDEHVH